MSIDDEITKIIKQQLYFGDNFDISSLPKDFLDRNYTAVNWHNICYYNELSEEFMERFLNYISFYAICQSQKLSIKFIEKYSHRLYLDMIPFCYFNKNMDMSWNTFL